MKTKYNTFETTYRNARAWALSCLAGSRLAAQRTYDTTSLEFQKRVYASFKQETQFMFGFTNSKIDRNTWIVGQNALKTNHTGKQTLKALCHSYFAASEALFLSGWTAGQELRSSIKLLECKRSGDRPALRSRMVQLFVNKVIQDDST